MGINESIMSDLADIGIDLGGDLAADAIGVIPIAGDTVAIGFIVKNLYEISDGTDELIAVSNTSEVNIDEIMSMQSSLMTDYIDLIQRILDAFPDPGATEAVAAATSFIDNAGKLLIVGKTLLNLDTTRGYVIEFLDKMNVYIKKLNDNLRDIKLPEDIDPPSILINGIDALKLSQDVIDNWEKANQPTIDATKQIDEI